MDIAKLEALFPEYLSYIDKYFNYTLENHIVDLSDAKLRSLIAAEPLKDKVNELSLVEKLWLQVRHKRWYFDRDNDSLRGCLPSLDIKRAKANILSDAPLLADTIPVYLSEDDKKELLRLLDTETPLG